LRVLNLAILRNCLDFDFWFIMSDAVIIPPACRTAYEFSNHNLLPYNQFNLLTNHFNFEIKTLSLHDFFTLFQRGIDMAKTKIDIAQALSDNLGYPKNQAQEVIEKLLGIIKETLGCGEELLISGFGKFEVKKKARRKGRNPASGKDMILESRNVVTFKCSGCLRKMIN
jgi:integration host factor subunit alpha